MPKERPTKKQRELLTFVENFIAGHGYGPSYREIKAGLGYNSVATVAKHINNLIARGHLRKKDHSARSLEVVGVSDDTSLPIRGARPTEAQEKWLVQNITERFSIAETAKPLAPSAVDELYVLVGALKILGLEGASQALIPRLADLKRRLSEDSKEA